MPTRLIAPATDAAAEADTADGPVVGGSAWGSTRSAPTCSARTGAGVVVAVLDTGIDATHPAFTGVTLVQQDFSGSGNGDKRATARTARAPSSAGTSTAPGSAWPAGVTRALIGKVLGDDGSGDSDDDLRRASSGPRATAPR